MGAKASQLRATKSLARLVVEQGRPNEARIMLADITTGSPKASTLPI
jgi:hypothetical protein